MALPTGILFLEPRNKPLDAATRFQPNAVRKFFLTDGVTLAPVYRDARFQYLLTQSPTPIAADGDGRFPAIYLNPAITYRAQLFSSSGVLLEDANPYVVIPYNSTFVSKQAPTQVINSTTLTADPDLNLQLPAAGRYTFESMLVFTTTNGGGPTPGLAASMSCTNVDSSIMAPVIGYGFTHTNFIFTFDLSAPTGIPTGISTPADATGTVLNVLGIVTVTAPATLAVTFSQGALDAAHPTILMPGSFLTIQRLS